MKFVAMYMIVMLCSIIMRNSYWLAYSAFTGKTYFLNFVLRVAVAITFPH